MQSTAHFSLLIGGKSLFCQMPFTNSPFTVFFLPVFFSYERGRSAFSHYIF